MVHVFSDVLASYASFLWDIDESEEEERSTGDTKVVVFYSVKVNDVSELLTS